MCDPQSERCRLCGKQDYKLTTVESNISRRIKVLFHLEVNIYCEEDKLPKSICSNCMFSVDSCWKFYLQVHRTQCELANANKKHFTDEEDPLVHIKLEPKIEVVESNESVNNDCTEDSPHVSDDDSQWTDTAVKPKKVFKFHGTTKTREVPLDPDETWSDYPWFCLTCKEHFDDKRAYNKHYCYRKYRRYFCFDCSKAFIVYNRFITHVTQFHWDRLKTHLLCQCDVCNRWFERKEEQEIHREQEHPHANPREEPKMPAYFSLTCEECGKTCATRYGLKLHMIGHSDKLPFVCETCGEAFQLPYALKTHETKYHTASENLLHCDQCAQTYKTKSELKKHMITHSMERPYICDICQKSFKRKYQVRNHISIHSDVKSHICETCGRAFRIISLLRQHRLSHSTEKPHKCPFCEKTFKTKEHLISHERQHTGEQPFSCTVCNRKFTSPGNRLKHMKRMHKFCPREKAVYENQEEQLREKLTDETEIGSDN